MKSTLISTAIALALGISVTQLHAQGQTTTQPNVPTTGNTVDDDVDQSNPNEANRDVDLAADPATSPETTRDLTQDDMDIEPIDDDEFVETASAKGHAEIETARMALEDGSQDLHAFANRMIEDHRAANDELRQIAQREGLEVADDPTLMDRARAMILEVRDDSFDEAYINNQIEAHEDTIELFRRAAQSETQSIQTFAQQQLPILQEHLRMANELKAQHDRRNSR